MYQYVFVYSNEDGGGTVGIAANTLKDSLTVIAVNNEEVYRYQDCRLLNKTLLLDDTTPCIMFDQFCPFRRA